VAATGVELQAVHLFRRARKGLHPGLGDQRRTDQLPASVTGSQSWEPKNYDGKYEGPMRMRTALAKSKNMVSIRLLQASGVRFVQDYVTRFGFEASKHPPYLTMALGAGSVTPWQMVTAYAVFANGGYRIRPYIVSQIQDDKNQVLAQRRRSPPATNACARSIRATPT
jgi:penicillin-binding protein 1A